MLVVAGRAVMDGPHSGEKRGVLGKARGGGWRRGGLEERHPPPPTDAQLHGSVGPGGLARARRGPMVARVGRARGGRPVWPMSL